MIYIVAISALSFVIYDKIIKVKKNILPDFTTLSNELWIIILIFIFQVFNNIKLSQAQSVKRKDAYIENRFKNLKRSYGNIIKEIIDNEVVEAICYAILIYETFNRPRVARIFEKLFVLGNEKTTYIGNYASVFK